ncbi:MAG: N-acetylmuramoyl-L-alanine amidase, partial [Myxococcales bacterium]|nr:N-acetylmuramoyl-L-alanine amidase [Myxococcales bacterium]
MRTVFYAALLSGCSPRLDAVQPSEEALPPVTDAQFVEGTLPTGFYEAAERTSVPPELLMAIAQAETSLQAAGGAIEHEGLQARFGVMGIPADRLAEAAALSGYTEDEIREDRVPNVVAAALLLEADAAALGLDTDALGGWAPAVAGWSGITEEDALAEYVHYEVFETLEVGLAVEGLELKPQPIDVDWPLPPGDGERTGQAGAVFTASPNHSSRGGVSPSYVVIHTCEGSYSSCWGWLKNPSSGVSAHYVVNSDGSEIRQLVDEDRKAWHIGADYACSRNSDVDCFRNGASMNTHSVGIEHAGHGSQTSWNSGLIGRSAELVCGITERHDIPLDRYHVFGHGQMQPWNRTDPGAAWPWASYMAQAETACGAAPSPGPTPTGVPLVIDSNNAANDPATHYVTTSSAWWSSANVSGHYNTGYWVANAADVDDPATFNFLAAAGQTCFDVEAWWPAAGDRSTAATFIAFDADGLEVGRVAVDQSRNGGRWNALGTFDFAEGWNRVALSRKAAPGEVVVADALR